MGIRLRVALNSALVMVVGLVTLLGLLVGDDLGALTTLVTATPIRVMARFFVALVVITAAMTILIGMMNLLAVHTVRVVRGPHGRINSLALLVSFLGALTLYAMKDPLSSVLLNDVQTSIESALAALLFFTLVLGAMRVMRRRMSLGGLLFVLSILIVLVGVLPLPALEGLAGLREWWLAIPASAGARGILLGIALATVVAGLRVLLAQDRSYGE